MHRSGFIIQAVVFGGMLIFCTSTISYSNSNVEKSPFYVCDYLMCQYEKENIDEIILSQAQKSQTLMFGEIHDTVIPGNPPPVGDSLYVISLLKRLKAIGFTYLALEAGSTSMPGTHSHDIVSFVTKYTAGQPTTAADYP
ncbi:MAG: hypothetical protein PVI90_10855, partial [Desulfobacteraceae bacterium]